MARLCTRTTTYWTESPVQTWITNFGSMALNWSITKVNMFLYKVRDNFSFLCVERLLCGVCFGSFGSRSVFVIRPAIYRCRKTSSKHQTQPISTAFHRRTPLLDIIVAQQPPPDANNATLRFVSINETLGWWNEV